MERGPLRLGFWQAFGEPEFPVYKMEVTALLYGSVMIRMRAGGGGPS